MVKNALSGRSTARAGEVVQLSDATPRSIDAVYVVANSLETRMIKPYVDVSVNPMGSLPIYTSSRGYDSAATEVASELNGMHIADMPLLLGGYEQQREQIALLWPQTQGDLLRLFAMGYDAVSLAENLQQMRKVGGMQQARHERSAERGCPGQYRTDAELGYLPERQTGRRERRSATGGALQ